MDLITLALAKKYTKETVEGAGAIKGKSAYEIALDYGFQGSEEEWIESLNGITPTIGENGNWFIGEIDTGVVAGTIIDEIQSDWNQNNKKASDYIKNKPFGNVPTGEYEEMVIFDVDTPVTQNVFYTENAFKLRNNEIPLDSEFYFVVDDIEEKAIFTPTFIDEGNILYDWYVESENCRIGRNEITFDSTVLKFPNTASHVKLYCMVESVKVKTLDEKYIPNTIARVLTSEDAIMLCAELGLNDQPVVANDGSIYTDENDIIYTLS